MSGAPAREPVSSALMAPVLQTARRLGVEADPEEARAKGAVWARLDDVRVAMGVRFVSGRAGNSRNRRPPRGSGDPIR